MELEIEQVDNTEKATKNERNFEASRLLYVYFGIWRSVESVLLVDGEDGLFDEINHSIDRSIQWPLLNLFSPGGVASKFPCGL
mmetsp:Transcript_7179/g.14083  ORF Transcript_7179/g.14083 Transcript_7179/m.14083 type:complete len:83 (-) Transcript_7179:2730-2978(-)